MDLPVKVQRGIVAPTYGNVYIADQIAEDKKVTHFLLPFTYILDFQEI